MYQRKPTLKTTTTKWRRRSPALSTAVTLSSPTAAILLLRGVSASNSTSVNDAVASNVVASPTPLLTSINEAVALTATLPIKGVGNNGRPGQVFPLGRCFGDCDSDKECQDGLICYQRDPYEPVPGCSGGERDRSRTDYCILPPNYTSSPSVSIIPTQRPTVSAAPTISSVPSAQTTGAPTAKPTTLPIKRVGNDGRPRQVYPLGRCFGDCDSDKECQEGLICYQRDPFEPVPGCSGGESNGSHTDVCILPPNYSSSPSVSAIPTQRPTVSAAPTITPVPSAQPSGMPTPAPNTISDKFKLRLYWDRSYFWQETRRETFWCFQCRDRCKEGTYIEIDHCRGADFFQYHRDDQSYRPTSNPDLCVTEDGYDSESRPLRLKKCTGSTRQKWVNSSEDGGFNLDRSKPWEIMPAAESDPNKEQKCVTQMHHPKAHEKVFIRRCKLPRKNDTSKWVLY